MRTSVVSSVTPFAAFLVWMLVAAAAPLVLTSCGSSVETVTAPGQTRCDLDVSVQTAAFPAGGGTGTLRVTTNRECTWAVHFAGRLTVSVQLVIHR